MARRLYMLPFDHRESFATQLFGWRGVLSAAQAAEITAAKHVVYDGFQAAIAGGAPKHHAAILVDERFGAVILSEASRQGYMTACPAERSGQREFAFEFGEEFARHIEAMNPTFCKVLVRYNPGGDSTLNQRQAVQLKRLSDYLHNSGRLFMFELLVHPGTSAIGAAPQQGPLRSGDASQADGASRSRSPGRRGRTRRVEGRRHGTAGGLRQPRRSCAARRSGQSRVHHAGSR